MGVVATFDYTSWITLYPQFSNIPQGTVTGVLLALAEVYLANDGTGPIWNINVQTQALGLMVAHLAQILFGANGDGGPSSIVGRVSSATEGTVTVASEFPMDASDAWYNQTPYGAAYWQMVLPWRLGRYFPKITQRIQPLAGPWAPGWWGQWGPGFGLGIGLGPNWN